MLRAVGRLLRLDASMQPLHLVTSILTLLGVAATQTSVVPAGFATTEGNASTNHPFGRGLNGSRFQIVYDTGALQAAGMSQPLRIDTLTWRANGGAQMSGGTFGAGSVTLKLGPAAVDHLAMSSAYDANFASATTWVLGPVVVGTPAGTTPNDNSTTLAVPGGFLFDPTAGQDLVIEVRVAAGSFVGAAGNSAAAPDDSHAAIGIGASRMTSGMPTAPTSNPMFDVATVLTFGWTPIVTASNQAYGTGCGEAAASIYQLFPTSAAAAAALSNAAIDMTRTPSGYLVSNGTAGVVPPTANATVLNLADDDETSVALSTPFPHSTGSTSTLWICSNGFVSVAQGNGTDYFSTVPGLLDAPVTAWWSWHDFDPSIPASGQVKFEEVGGVAYVTWDGVFGWGSTTSAGATTVQFQFELATGNVRIAFGSVAAVVDGHLVGFSPGGASLDPGSTNYATGLPRSLAIVDQPRLTLAASNRAVIGTTVSYVLGAIPATAFVNAHMMAFGGVDPGLPLAGAGAPGCTLYVDLPSAVLTLTVGGPTAGHSFAVPYQLSLLGITLDNQGLSLVPGSNALGIVTSNGIASMIGSQ